MIIALASKDDSALSKYAKGIRQGNVSVYRDFFEEYYPMLYRFLISRGMSHDEAEDLVQQAFIIIWDNRKGIDATKSLKAYLIKIAYTQMLNHIKYQSRFKDEDPPESGAGTQEQESDSDYIELWHLMKNIIAQMPEKRALVFEMCFINELTYKETANILEVSVKTVENHMALAFKEMRGKLKKIYGADRFMVK